MAATAVGMFQNAAVAESVAESLRNTSRPPRSVQVFAGDRKSSNSPPSGRASTPLPGSPADQVDGRIGLLSRSSAHNGDLSRDEARAWDSFPREPAAMVQSAGRISDDLRLIGAQEPEIAIYLSGLNRGHAVVLATGTLAQADAASARMNRFHPIEVESRHSTAEGATHDPDILNGNPEIVSYPDFGIFAAESARLFCW